MESLILTLAEGRVVPRKLRLSLSPGEGRLALEGPARVDWAWRDSTEAAWAAARRLAGRHDVDARLEVIGAKELTGGSAGLSLGLLALAALLEEPLPPHFATGAVLDADGFLAGGSAAGPKAAAAATFAPQLAMPDALFLCPPVRDAPRGLPSLRSCDLGSAFARLSPKGYARVEAAHRAILHAPGSPGGRFARVERSGEDPPLGSEVGGIALQAAVAEGLGDAARVTLGEEGRLLWRAVVPRGLVPGIVPELFDLARPVG